MSLISPALAGSLPLAQQSNRDYVYPLTEKNNKTQTKIYENTVSDIEQQIEQDFNPCHRGNQVGEHCDNILPQDDKLTYHLTYDKLTVWREFSAAM